MHQVPPGTVTIFLLHMRNSEWIIAGFSILLFVHHFFTLIYSCCRCNCCQASQRFDVCRASLSSRAHVLMHFASSHFIQQFSVDSWTNSSLTPSAFTQAYNEISALELVKTQYCDCDNVIMLIISNHGHSNICFNCFKCISFTLTKVCMSCKWMMCLCIHKMIMSVFDI